MGSQMICLLLRSWHANVRNSFPAMNINMFENPVVQDNLKILEHYGYEVIAPVCGYLVRAATQEQENAGT